MDYIYETHSHTVEASACAGALGKDYIAYMMEKGYSGMVITDHFFNGNSCIPRELPWEEWIAGYCAGYEHAKEAAEGTGFTVLFGVEYNFQGDEYLLYGIDKAWLLSHPDMLNYTRQQLYEEVHKAGGIMVQAHPYRERNYIQAIHLAPSACDGIESYNAANKDYQNALAYQYAKQRNLPMTGGSDIHHLHDGVLGGVRASRPLTKMEAFMEALLGGELIPVSRQKDGRFVDVADLEEQCQTEQEPTLPVVWHEE